MNSLVFRNRNEWYDYFTQFKEGMVVALQVDQSSSYINTYMGRVVGTLNTRNGLLERWIVQLQVYSDGTLKTAYLDSRFGVTEFYFRDNHFWHPKVLRVLFQ
jgi:hypothetical protein